MTTGMTFLRSVWEPAEREFGQPCIEEFDGLGRFTVFVDTDIILVHFYDLSGNRLRESLGQPCSEEFDGLGRFTVFVDTDIILVHDVIIYDINTIPSLILLCRNVVWSIVAHLALIREAE